MSSIRDRTHVVVAKGAGQAARSSTRTGVTGRLTARARGEAGSQLSPGKATRIPSSASTGEASGKSKRSRLSARSAISSSYSSRYSGGSFQASSSQFSSASTMGKSSASQRKRSKRGGRSKRTMSGVDEEENEESGDDDEEDEEEDNSEGGGEEENSSIMKSKYVMAGGLVFMLCAAGLFGYYMYSNGSGDTAPEADAKADEQTGDETDDESGGGDATTEAAEEEDATEEGEGDDEEGEGDDAEESKEDTNSPDYSDSSGPPWKCEADTSCSVKVTKTLPSVSHSLAGYNLAYGFPFGEQVDPGFRDSIFKSDTKSTDGMENYVAECSFVIPVGLTFEYIRSCNLEFEAHLARDERTLRLAMSPTTSVQGASALAGVAFSASVTYKKTTETFEKNEKELIYTFATCKIYKLKLNEYCAPQLRSAFMAYLQDKFLAKKGLKNFTNEYDEEKTYFEFFKKFGTHYPTEVTYGSLLGHRYKLSAETRKSMTAQEYDVKAAASATSLKTASGGAASANVNVRTNTSIALFQNGSTSYSYSKGVPPPAKKEDQNGWAALAGKDDSDTAPLTYSLAGIEKLFIPRFFRKQFEEKKITEKALEELKQKITHYKRGYCAMINRFDDGFQGDSRLRCSDVSFGCGSQFFASGKYIDGKDITDKTEHIKIKAAACYDRFVVYTYSRRNYLNPTQLYGLDIDNNNGEAFPLHYTGSNVIHAVAIDGMNGFIFLSVENAYIQAIKVLDGKSLGSDAVILYEEGQTFSEAMFADANSTVLYYTWARKLYMVKYGYDITQRLRGSLLAVTKSSTISGITIEREQAYLLFQSIQGNIYRIKLNKTGVADGECEVWISQADNAPSADAYGLSTCEGTLYWMNGGQHTIHTFYPHNSRNTNTGNSAKYLELELGGAAHVPALCMLGPRKLV